ncbi:MAG TPA: transketolase family protein [Candidatus Nanoarchaeia archaeon]|nr:transketolase family protein [Candidatus Nanoarchaeia archaeon]
MKKTKKPIKKEPKELFEVAKHLNPNLFKKTVEQVPTRNGFGEGLVVAAEKNNNILGLCADLTDSTKMNSFKDKFPLRFIEVGVAEQNMMGIAAGLALNGKITFLASYAVFSPGRNWDQLRVSVCYNNVNVKVIGAHAGISVGPDGATHQALEDVAITRVLPNLTVVVPCDSIETKKATQAIAEKKGPCYLRLTREKTPIITTLKSPFIIGKAEILAEGTDVTLIGAGPVLYEALVAANELQKQKISCQVINCHTIKPIDAKTIINAAKKTKAFVTIEEHQINGGIGSAISEVITRNYPIPIEFIGMPNSFGESGQPDELLNKYEMKSKHIILAVKKVLKRKSTK